MIKRILILPVLLIIFQFSIAQNYIEQFDGYRKWSGLEDHDFELEKRFDSHCRENSLLVDEFGMIEASNENTWNYLTTVDLNDDTLLDIVYSGPSGGEASIVHFFIQTESEFIKVFEVMQGIAKIEWKGELLHKIYSQDWGCCAETQLFNSVFQVTYNENNLPKFQKIYQSVELQDVLRKPKSYFKKPIRFKVESDGYKLRFQPKIDDETEFYSVDAVGNTIGTLRKGSTGTAYASKDDKTGRIWWYVAIDPQFEISGDLLSRTFEYPTHVIGWLSSRYVSAIHD